MVYSAFQNRAKANNGLASVKSKLVLKLPRFFPYHVGEENARQLQNQHIFHRSESVLIFLSLLLHKSNILEQIICITHPFVRTELLILAKSTSIGSFATWQKLTVTTHKGDSVRFRSFLPFFYCQKAVNFVCFLSSCAAPRDIRHLQQVGILWDQ